MAQNSEFEGLAGPKDTCCGAYSSSKSELFPPSKSPQFCMGNRAKPPPYFSYTFRPLLYPLPGSNKHAETLRVFPPPWRLPASQPPMTAGRPAHMTEAEALQACRDSVQASKEVNACPTLLCSLPSSSLARPSVAAHARGGRAGAGKDRRGAAQVRASAQLVSGEQAWRRVCPLAAHRVILARACTSRPAQASTRN